MDAVQQLREIDGIKRLKYRYMRGIDEKRWDEVEACFVPEATCAYSGSKYSFSGRDAILKFLTESMARPTFLSSHRVHQPEIDLTSDETATGIWALDDYVIDEENGLTIHGAAFYRDEYVKRGGEWKIKRTGYTRTFEQMQKRDGRGWNLTQRGFAASPDAE